MNGIALLNMFAGFVTGVLVMAIGSWLLLVWAKNNIIGPKF